MTTMSMEDAIRDAGIHEAKCDSCGAEFFETPDRKLCSFCDEPVTVLSKSERFDLAIARSDKTLVGQMVWNTTSMYRRVMS